MLKQETLPGFLYKKEVGVPQIGEAYPHVDSVWRLMLATEKHICLFGVDGVRVAGIISEAGCGNAAALHYHFGGLLGAAREIYVVRERLVHSVAQLGLDLIDGYAKRGEQVSLQHLLLLKALLWGSVTISTRPLCYYAGFFDFYRRWDPEWSAIMRREFAQPAVIELEERIRSFLRCELGLNEKELQRRYFFTVGLICRAFKRLEQDQRYHYSINHNEPDYLALGMINKVLNVVESIAASIMLERYRNEMDNCRAFFRELLLRLEKPDWPAPKLAMSV